VRGDAALVVAAFAAVWLVWGSTYLAIAWAVETIPPLAMIGGRCLLAGAVLYGWTRFRGGPRPTAVDWRAAALAGALMFVTGQAVLAWAETRIASGPAALLIATEPLFIVLLRWRGGRLVGAAGQGPRPGGRSVAALVGGFAGVGLMVLPGGDARLDALGAAATLFASASWCVGVFHARPRPGLSAVQVAGMQLLTAGAMLTGIALATGDAARLAATGPSARSLLAFGYLVVFGSLVTFSAYAWLLERVGPARLSTHAYVNPVVAVVLGGVLGGEVVTGPLVFALALILGSVAVLVREKEDREPTGAEREARAQPDVGVRRLEPLGETGSP